MSWMAATRARVALLFGRQQAESRMDDEIRFHIDMETAKRARNAALDPVEARRQALVAFGGIERYKEELRDGRGTRWLSGLTLDFKLGFRMLVKYPGLTLVGGLAMAFAIAVGAVTFELVTAFTYPTLPLPGGERVVQLRNWDVSARRPAPQALYDFLVWRKALTTVADIGAYRDARRNLITANGDAHPVKVAEVTASAFRIAPTPPLLGRVIVASDEQGGAPPVVVIGYDVWRNRLAGDSGVVGRTVQLGDTYATVVGVMPEGFAFPVSHEVWTPFRTELFEQQPGEGPGITVFGRIAPDATREKAQAELTLVGRRATHEHPATHEHLQPQVAPYAKLFQDLSTNDLRAMFLIPLFAVMLLVLICGNVALLLFARAATRENEIVVRSALGASRARIIAQLVAEALVLGGFAAILGLAAAQFGLTRWGTQFLEGNMGKLPFWYDISLSAPTVVYAIGLTVLSAVIAGVMPALKITRGIGSRLRYGTAGGGLRFGGVWTVVIVAQVALTVAFPAAVFVEQRELVRIETFDPGFHAGQYLGVGLEMDPVTTPGAESTTSEALRRSRFGAALEALRQRVIAEPGVTGVTFVDRLPRLAHTERLVEVDDAVPASAQRESASAAVKGSLPEITIATIDPSYFSVLDAPMVAGRAFSAADLLPNARVVIVDQGFVDEVMHGRNAVGRRIRFPGRPGAPKPSTEPPGPWYQIVGVAKDLGMGYLTHQTRAAGVYHPLTPDHSGTLNMIVHSQGDPMSLAPKIRELATAVDANLRPTKFQRLDNVADSVLWLVDLWVKLSVLLTAIALLLSLAGIYAVLSFTVARRTREIGVRVALGASRKGVVVAIFRRPLRQVALGVLIGGSVVGTAAIVISTTGLTVTQGVELLLYIALMFGVCLLACIVPTRRALGVEPTEALRAE